MSDEGLSRADRIRLLFERTRTGELSTEEFTRLVRQLQTQADAQATNAASAPAARVPGALPRQASADRMPSYVTHEASRACPRSAPSRRDPAPRADARGAPSRANPRGAPTRERLREREGVVPRPCAQRVVELV